MSTSRGNPRDRDAAPGTPTHGPIAVGDRRRPRLAPIRGRLSAFDAGDDGITAARLGLALTVVVSHSVSRGGFGAEPLVTETHGHVSLGVAVVGFFALSGFLLTRSRERTPIVAFVRNRGLRILPGYWVALLFGALVAAPLGAALSRCGATAPRMPRVSPRSLRRTSRWFARQPDRRRPKADGQPPRSETMPCNGMDTQSGRLFSS